MNARLIDAVAASLIARRPRAESTHNLNSGPRGYLRLKALLRVERAIHR